MPKSPRRVFIVSHTHWDREWYLTFHEFRVNLLRVFRQVLDTLEEDGDFRHFVMDGQAIALEDHLEIHPEDETRIRALCAEGKLSLGPWYILPDEFLVSGEAMLRNLLVGHQVCRCFGEPQKVGYMPDSFGHLAQIPQLLRGAGIDSFIYTRGNGDEMDELGHEYIWAAPDGSEVLAVNQCGGYCNAGGLGFQEIWHAHTRREISTARAIEQVGELFAKMEELSNGQVRLLNNGCDHFPRQRDFGRVLDALRETFPGTDFVHTGFSEFLAALRGEGVATKRHTGELLGGKQHLILSGVWSARMYLKQANEKCQNLLERVWEPAAVAAHFLHGHEYPQGLLDYAWKLLMENHPHDSICGCSTDDVHRDMEPRFRGVLESGRRWLTNFMDSLTPHFGREEARDRDTVITVFNPIPERRSEFVERLVLLQPLGYDIERLRLFNEAGEQIPFEIVEKLYVERFWGIDYRSLLNVKDQRAQLQIYLDRFGERFLKSEAEKDSADCFLRIQFLAENLPGVGHGSYFLRETKAPASGESPTSGETRLAPDKAVWIGDAVAEHRGEGSPPPIDPGGQGHMMENEFLIISLRCNGLFDLEDKRSGKLYAGLGRFVDCADIGDEYDFSPADPMASVYSGNGGNKSHTNDAHSGRVRVIEDGTLACTLEADFTLPLPARIDEKRERRSGKNVDCRVRTRLTLRAGSPMLDIETVFDNRVEDHRLNVEFNTNLDTDTLVSDGHYLIHERPLTPPQGDDWAQPHPGSYPQQDWSALQSDGKGLALFNRGLPEIIPTAEPGMTRTGADAGGSGMSPSSAEAREPGGSGMSLTLLRCVGWLSRDDFDSRRRTNAGPTIFTPEAQCLGEHSFRYALLPFQGDHLSADVAGHSRRWRAEVLTSQGVEDQHIPGGVGLLETEPGPVAVTAIKRQQERDTLIVRICNLSNEDAGQTLRCGLEIAKAWRCNLIEEREEKIPCDCGELTRNLRGHGIECLELELR